MFEETRPGQSAARPEIDRLCQREAELLREVQRHSNDRAIFDALLLRNRTNLESYESMTSQGHLIIRELRSEDMQMRASAVPPNLTRDLEGKIESQKYEIQSLQIILQTTQDSLNTWDEVNFNPTQGVCVGENAAASTSSVGRITELLQKLHDERRKEVMTTRDDESTSLKHHSHHSLLMKLL